ncbi:cell division protein FtsK [Arthrobacter citreus]|nr:cell division protein FtsK [Arthrobacter citreus]
MIVILFSSIVSTSIVVGLGASIGVIKPRANDKKTIKRLFEIANVCVKEKDIIKYPTFKKSVIEDNYVSYFYRLPLGIPSKLIIKFQEILSEGLNKPVNICFDNYKLEIKVYYSELPEKVKWSEKDLKIGTWEVPIGKSLDGMVYHDFDKINHLIMGGTTGYGKSVLVHMIKTSLILQQPENVQFFIIDLKGGLEFKDDEKLKQVVKVATNLKEVFDLLSEVKERMENEIKFFRSKGIKNIVDSDISKRTFLIIDEGADLEPAGLEKDVKKICQHWVSEIARKGRAVGFRILLATQYPTAQVISSQIKAQCDCKIGFRLTTDTESGVVIDQKGLEELPIGLRGRIIRKTDRIEYLQVPYIEPKRMEKVLRVYEEEKRREARTNPSKYEEFKVRNKKTTTRNTQSRGNKKRSKTTEKPSRDGIIISD